LIFFFLFCFCWQEGIDEDLIWSIVFFFHYHSTFNVLDIHLLASNCLNVKDKMSEHKEEDEKQGRGKGRARKERQKERKIDWLID